MRLLLPDLTERRNVLCSGKHRIFHMSQTAFQSPITSPQQYTCNSAIHNCGTLHL